MRAMVVGCALGASCGGGKATDFAAEYVDLYCAWYLDCADPALQVFDGMDTLEECQAAVGPAVADNAEACKLDRVPARACLDGLAVASCPAEGALLEESVPYECGFAFKDCAEGVDGS
jgi:hypothetical protein